VNEQLASFSATGISFAEFFNLSTGGALAALAGADTLTGSSQVDILAGHGGADTMDGKDGGDGYVFANGDVVSGENRQ
jgi:Ca2+-binding RTX toxin-like protein